MMTGRRSFSVRSLIAETPRSNRSRLAFLLKRGSPLKLSTSGSRRRRLLKRKLKLDSSPKARRCLDLDWEWSSKSGIGTLVTKEAESLEKPVSLTIYRYAGPGALFGKYVDIVGEMYPALTSRIISSPSFDHIFWLEILSPSLIYDVNLGPVSYL